ncbi:MAG: hypothetical protein OER86_11765, partial [Phycisphaerae bacterium]|nr:hypothetical protein [Phycisphaerae bacterium]
KPFDPVLVALDVEAKHPELASVLVSYTQLQGPIENQPNVSSDLVGAMRDQAIERTRPIDFREIIDFGQLKTLLIVTVGVLLLFGILGANWQEHMRTLLRRLAGATTDYPTQTQIAAIEVKDDRGQWVTVFSADDKDEDGGNVRVRIGDTADVRTTVNGITPQAGDLYFKYADGEGGWKRVPIRKNENRPSFTRTFDDITRDIVYYVRINDDQSEEHRITVVPAPRVVGQLVELKYPPYMNRAAATSDQLNFEVPEGTELSWKLRCDPAVEKMQVTIGEETFDAKVEDGGRLVTFDRLADKGFKYAFRWTEAGSGNSFEYDDVQHSVRVVADKAPDVELMRPTGNGLATVWKTLKLVAKANDDHGLSKAWLVYSVDGSNVQKRLAITDFQGVPSGECDYTWVLREGIEGLEPGSQITFHIEVLDLYPGAEEHVSRSATRTVSVVDAEAYLQWYREELAAQREEIKRARDTERAASTQVKQLKDQESEDQP